MIRFAIVGYGNIGKRHAQHIINNPEAELVAICDIDPQKQALMPKGPKFYPNIVQLLAHGKADVINICTPNYLHCEQSILAMKAGFHAVVEKPMALKTADCRQMIDVAQQTERKLFCVKQNRYNPPVMLVKELIERQRLGRPYMVQVNCFWNRSDTYYQQSPWRGKKAMDGGCLFTQFSHFVDILYYLNGGIKEIKGKVMNFNHLSNTEFEDSGVFAMAADNGALVSFNFSTCAYDKNMEGAISILAEKGTIKIGGQYLNTIEYQTIENEKLPQINISAKENDYGLYKGSMSNHDKIIENVIDVLAHGGMMMTTPEDGLHVVDIIERMYQASQA